MTSSGTSSADWYVEMAKVRLKQGDRSPLPVLAYVLQSSLRLLHPFMPFVTEAVWQHLRDAVEGLEAESIMVARTRPGDGERDAEAEERMQTVMDVVRAIRNIRADRGVDPARYVEAYIRATAPSRRSKAVAADGRGAGRACGPCTSCSERRLRRRRPAWRRRSSPKRRSIVPLAGLIDLDAERTRLSAQLAEAEGEVRRLEGKLGNEQFRSKAPADVVAREEEKLAAARSRAEGCAGRLAD